MKCWTETRSDTVKTKHMIDNYINVVGEDAAIGRQKPGRKPPCPWRIVEYFKTTFQKTEVVRDSQGKMMWEEEYYEFAQTAAGHKLGDAQARKNWAEWKRQKDENTDSLVWDLLGPERAPLQFWVHTGKFLTYRDTQGESNRVERSGKQLKKATQEDIEKLEKMAFNTNEFGENDEHLHDTARRMVQQSSNSGSALGGSKMLFGDIRSLLEDHEFGGLETSGNAVEHHASGGGGGGGGTAGAKGSPNAKTSSANSADDWWDRACEVNSAKRAAQTQHAALVKSVGKTVTDLEAAVNEAKMMSSAVAGLDSEIALADSRLQALQLIHTNDSSGLKEFICTITKGGRGMGADNAPSAARSPPSRYYMKLETLDAIQAVNVYDTVTDKRGLLRIAEECNQKKSYIMELMNASKTAMADLKRALTFHKKDSGKVDTNRAEKKKRAERETEANKRHTHTEDVFEFGLAVGQQIDIISSAEELKNKRPWLGQIQHPFIISFSVVKPVMGKLLQPESEMLSYTTQFGKTMEAEAKKGQAGCQRGQRLLPPMLSGQVKAFFSEVMPDDTSNVPLADGGPEVASSCLPTAFGIVPDVSFCQAEKHHLGCMRVAWRGSRTIVCATEGDVFKMISQRDTGSTPTFKQLWDFWLHIDKATMDEFAATGFKAGVNIDPQNSVGHLPVKHCNQFRCV